MENVNKQSYEIIIKKDGETVVNEKTNCILAAFRSGEQAVRVLAGVNNATPEEVARCIAGVKKQINDLYNRDTDIKNAVCMLELLKMLKEWGEK